MAIKPVELEKEITPAVEDIPKEIRGAFIKKTGTSDGTKEGEKNRYHQVNEQIKYWAKSFSNYGVDLNKLNLEDYRVVGITLEKYPKNSITIALVDQGYSYGPYVLVYDNRPNFGGTYTETGINEYWSTPNLYRSRDQKTVPVSKISALQILGEAKTVWVIPAEELPSVTELKGKRQKARYGKIERTKAQEWNTSYDKSGYYISPGRLRDKLREYKIKKTEESGNLETVTKAILAKIAKYNSINSEINEILTSSTSLESEKGLSGKIEYKKIGEIFEALMNLKKDIIRHQDDLKILEENLELDGELDLGKAKSLMQNISYDYRFTSIDGKMKELKELFKTGEED